MRSVEFKSSENELVEEEKSLWEIQIDQWPQWEEVFVGQEELTELDAVCLLCVLIFEIFVFNNKEVAIAVY